MAVRVVTGPPGTGKTLTLTEMALEEFKVKNKKKKNKNLYYNSIFSNYPILLKKVKKSSMQQTDSKNMKAYQ